MATDPATVGVRSRSDGELLPKRSAYDFVIVGGGPNGLTAAAYLAKWGFSVCVLEARPELGGGAENHEPSPGFSIDPHATYFYGAAAPALGQLELGRYGLRASPVANFGGCASPDGRGFFGAGNFFHEGKGRDPDYLAQLMGVSLDVAKVYVEFMSALEPHLTDFFRSIYWTPPYDEKWGMTRSDLPWAQVMREALPFFDEVMLEWSLCEMMNAMGLPDPFKTGLLVGSWGNGPHPYHKGMAIPGFAVQQLMFYSNCTPVGGMHALAHSIIRCGLAHGVRMYVNAPVTEVLVEGGRAVGVRVDDDTALEEKTIRANMGVILNTHVKQLPELVSGNHLSQDFVQRIDDISLKGGSLFVANMAVSELPQYTSAGREMHGADYPVGMLLHSTEEQMLDLMRDVYSFNTHPTDPDHYQLWLIVHSAHDATRAPDGMGVITMNLQVPPPEDHRDGPDAVNKASDEIMETIYDVIHQYAPNMTRDKFVKTWVNTPRDSEFRNMAFVGGHWWGMRGSEDEWFSRKPLPELARYRTPVEGMYLCHQTSYPGGLCLLAVPYNLMHILAEDYTQIGSTTPEWWYPSKWHITDTEGGTR